METPKPTPSISKIYYIGGALLILLILISQSNSTSGSSSTGITYRSPVVSASSISTALIIAKTCIQDQEISRKCNACKAAELSYYNVDCSISTKTIEDSSCSSLCPIPATPPPVVVYEEPTPSYKCNCKKTCPNMSCDEAQFQLNSCGCKARDADKDGIACDSQCQ